MNNVYRIIWNAATGQWTVASEFAKGRKKSGQRTILSVAVTVAVLLPSAGVIAQTIASDVLPTGGQVVGGQAAIGQSGSAMRIDQSTQRAAINWQTFDIGQDASVTFNQPNAQAQTLNRVIGGVPSNIQGQLLANGQVLIQNANGVLFGQGSTVNVGSLLATTKNIDPNQFMEGGALSLSSTGSSAGVINDGTINAQGYVTFVGDQIRNSGMIKANQVVLAAGDSATVALDNGQGVSVMLSNASAHALVENSGNIQAGENGSVLITARGANTVLDTVINLSGVVKAGTIVADAATTGDVVVTGQLDASNNNAGGQGGVVVLSGDRVGLFGNASINVTGDVQGGLAIIGGDNLNKIPGTSAAGLIDQVVLASYTQVDQGVVIDAGSAHGDGGFVETSGQALALAGTISAAAPNGKAGLWLIDPTNIVINTAASSSSTQAGGTFSPTATATTTAVVNNGSIETALATTDVLITTNVATAGTAAGNITLAAGTNITSTSTNNLTMEAVGNISVQGNITLGGGNLNLTADAGNAGLGGVGMGAASTIDLGGGTLNISGNTTATTGLGVNLQGAMVNVGSATITGKGGSANSGVQLAGNFSLVALPGGDVTIVGSSNGAHGINLANGTLAVTGGNLTLDGNAAASASGQGVIINGTVSVTDGTLNITGVSNGSFGLSFNNGSAVSLSRSDATLSGTSNTGSGGRFLGGTLSVTDSSTLNVTAVGSASGISSALAHNLNISGGSHVTLNGTGGTGTGVSLHGNISVTDNSTLDIIGTSNSGTGAFVGDAAPNTLYVSGASVTVDGTSNTGPGVDWFADTLITDNGTLDIVGRTNAGLGVLIDGNITNNNGAISVAGSSAGEGTLASGTVNVGAGVAVLGNLTTAGDNASTTITGTSTTDGSGVLILGPDSGLNHNTASGPATTGGSISSTGNGSTDITGTSNSGSGVSIENNVASNTGGTIDISGNSTSGSGVTVSNTGTIASTDQNSTVNVSGNSSLGSGIDLDGTLNATSAGVINLDGASDSGAGVNIGAEGSVSADGNDSLIDVTGTSNTGNGVTLDGDANSTNGGTVNITGNATDPNGNGTGVAIGESANVTSDGTGSSTNVTGNAAGTGDGVVLDGSTNSSNGGLVSIIGGSTGGAGVDIGPNGTVSSDGNGSSTNVTGDSMTGTGVDNSGNMGSTNGGSLNITGESTNGTGVNNDGFITSDGNGSSTNVTANSTDGIGLNNDGSIIESNGGTVTIIANGNPRIAGNGTFPDGVLPSSPPLTSSASSGSGSGGSALRVVGVGAIVGLVAALSGTEAAWSLETAQALTIEAGDQAVWYGSQLSCLDVHAGTANVCLNTQQGQLQRTLTLQDSGDGVRHYASEDSGIRTQLSINPETREYFFTETGVVDGKPYTVKAHGWLTKK